MEAKIVQADCLEWLRTQADDSVDLILCSPPYEAARTYGIDFKLRGQDWVDWAVERYLECVRVSRGLVAWVVEGQTRQFRWSATPALLMADLHRAGVKLRKPPIFKRVGIPGSGGPDWWRNDYEFVVCSTKGKLPWSDNTATGHPPKFPPGGLMSNRHVDGRRKNDSAGPVAHARWGRDGRVEKVRPLERTQNGSRNVQMYVAPVLSNPGNIVNCGVVGGGNMGSKLCHDNEAPYSEKLCEPFVLSFCPPGGTVCDIFSGSGTTAAVALKNVRNFTGCDIRASQVELTKRRIAEVQPTLFTETA